LHHHVGSAPGVFRPPLSNLRAALDRFSGMEIRRDTPARIEVRDGTVAGVALASGETLAAPLVVSGLPPARTLLELIDPGGLDPQLVRALRNVRSRGVVAEMDLVLDRHPGFSTLVIAPALDYLERAYDDAKHGRISTNPYLEARHAGADAHGKHRVRVHVQYVPYVLRGAVWDTALATTLGRTVLAKLAEHSPGFTDAVVEQHLLAPDDLEHLHGFPQGHAYHAELALDQVLWMRPLPQLAQYRTPVPGLYLCGPAMHPGAGTAGAAGANAASVILRDVRRGLMK
jgi:phytoene dehydrogenase-like protein